MKKKYIVWWFIPLLLLVSMYLDKRSPDTMFPLIYFTGMLSFILLIMGFVYRELEVRKTGNIETIIVNLCLFYTLLYSALFVLANFRNPFGRWILQFVKLNHNSNISLKLFIIAQVISILLLILIAIRERKN